MAELSFTDRRYEDLPDVETKGESRKPRFALGKLPCALSIDGNPHDYDIPLRYTMADMKGGETGSQSRRPHEVSVDISAHTQLPGLVLVYGEDSGRPLIQGAAVSGVVERIQTRTGARFLITPDICEDIKVDVVTFEEERERRELLTRCPGVKVFYDDSKMNAELRPPNLCLMEVVIRFRHDQHPIAQYYAPDTLITSTPLLSSMTNCSTLSLLVAPQGIRKVHEAQCFKIVIERCYESTWASMRTMWAYTSQYQQQPGLERALAHVVSSDYIEKRLAPQRPRWLLDPDDRAADDKAKVFDVGYSSTAKTWPLIATIPQWVALYTVALIRELQLVSPSATHQLSALGNLIKQAPRPLAFDVREYLISKPCVLFNISFKREFENTSTWKDGRAITPAERATASKVYDHLIKSTFDQDQHDFLEQTFARCTNGYHELTGAPRTGKTWLLAALAIMNVTHGQKVIVASKTDKAVNKLLQEYHQHVGSLSSEGHNVSNRVIWVRSATVEAHLRVEAWNNYSNVGGAAALPNLASGHQSLAYTTLLAATTCSDGADQRLIAYHDELVKPRDVTMRLSEEECMLTIAENAEDAVLETCNLVFATPDILASLLKQRRVKSSALFVDEASRMTMPDFIQMLDSNDDCRLVVVAGDPNQLKPKARSATQRLSEYGSLLNLSPFEAMWVLPQQRSRLTSDMGNPDAIVQLINQLSYKDLKSCRDRGRIADSHTVQQLQRARADLNFMDGAFLDTDFAAAPIVFVDDPTSPSEKYGGLLNNGGILTCIELIGQLVRAVGIEPSNIAGLSMFVSDAREWSRQLAVNRLGFADIRDKITITSVSDYQDEEADIVVLHLVSCGRRAEWTIGDIHQLNVAVTRAKVLLIIVGPWDALKGAASDYSGRTKTMKKLVESIAHTGIIIPSSVVRRMPAILH